MDIFHIGRHAFYSVHDALAVSRIRFERMATTLRGKFVRCVNMPPVHFIEAHRAQAKDEIRSIDDKSAVAREGGTSYVNHVVDFEVIF